MTLMCKLSPRQWALYLALLIAGFETGRGIARMERGESFLPSLLTPAADLCCTMTVSLSPLLA